MINPETKLIKQEMELAEINYKLESLQLEQENINSRISFYIELLKIENRNYENLKADLHK